MEKDPIYVDIVEFIRKYNGILVNENTRLFKDLELIGDDADLFLIRFSDRFKVDFDDLIVDEYFLPEFNIPFQYWYYKKFKPSKLKRKEFLIDHLIEVVKIRKWFECPQMSVGCNKL